MILFDEQTINDLEFSVVRDMLIEACIENTARERMRILKPLNTPNEAAKELDLAHELLCVKQEESESPRIEFEELKAEIQRLEIKGGVLDLEGFVKLLDASSLGNELAVFFNKREESYPNLVELTNELYFTNHIIDPIEKVLDKRLQVKDDASAELFKIRSQIRSVRKQINRNFDKVLRKLQSQGILGDTTEAYLDNRRVLSVISNQKRSVPGNVLGSSNSGSLTYIEPHENVPLNYELENLLDDEQKEIRRIFLKLTNDLRGMLPLIKSYQHVFTELDFIQAKVRVGIRMKATRPAMSDDQTIELIDAYHPLLLMANNEMKVKTLPQSLLLDKFCRMLVISGPNAGGKSITLKTVGLLQLMFQSGLLIPADPSSKFGWFHAILSDIGDNQSIANQLSTYSYRLKRMKYFLEVANRRSLLLLDEFGTGSDPDLGGALAEVFFETLYNRKSFGVITTHYSNIKLKASKLRNAQNASMLFDKESLEPLYRLSLGQPGSSFTFEVAQINGIDQELIEDAKTRLDIRKVELDKLIADLQKEKSQIDKLNIQNKKAREEADTAKSEYEALQEHFEARLDKQQEMIDKNNRQLNYGNKVEQFIEKYNLKSHNRELFGEVKKFLAIEKTKIEDRANALKLKAEKKASDPKPKRQKENLQKKKPVKPVILGSVVRLINSSQQGQVVELKDKDAVVLFGNFKTKTKVDDLEVV
ncbi:MAG: DNA mismatch repair protein MutS [Salibacteraceae bacterium]|jgi:DNA mismatch repair protein MutS2|nr:DNA mismatch repair protein MutS [Salibacteraceae bacterium]MDP4845437.1 DNA mismatch repair protein MutS [Salibacteraceae bacterium]